MSKALMLGGNWLHHNLSSAHTPFETGGQGASQTCLDVPCLTDEEFVGVTELVPLLDVIDYTLGDVGADGEIVVGNGEEDGIV